MNAYPIYKSTEYKWLGDIPAHWEWLFLSQACHSQEIKNADNSESNVLSLSYGRIIRKKDINFGLVPNYLKGYIFVDNGNIILRLTDLQNDRVSLRTGLVRERGIITSAYTCLVPSQNSEYLQLLLHSYDVQKYFYGLGGGVRQSIGFKDIKYTMIPLPSREEQDRIVRWVNWQVSRISDYTCTKKREIECLRELKKAIISEAVSKVEDGWQQFRIKEVARILRGKFSHRPRNDPDYYGGKYPFIQTGDVACAGKYIREYKQTLNENGYSVSKQFPKGTLTMTIAANIGDVAILDFDACFPDSIIGFVPYNGIDLEYLYYALFSMKADFVKEAPVNTQGNLNMERVGAMTIYVPQEEKQRKIVHEIENCVASIDKAISKLNEQIALFGEYKASIISDAVTGKIDLRNAEIPDFEPLDELINDTEEGTENEDN